MRKEKKEKKEKKEGKEGSTRGIFLTPRSGRDSNVR
jgi:hypothetical protein